MGARKKDPAALRTLDIFTKRTPLEEAEMELQEGGQIERADPRDMVASGERTAIRWLGLDMFHDGGDDIKVAVHPKGHAVLMLVRATVPGAPFHTATIKLTKTQWTKLQEIVRDAATA